MILINLLPQELRIKEIKRINIPYRPIAFVIFLIFLLLSLYNLFLFIRVRERHRNFSKQWKALEPRSNEADLLERELGATIVTEVDFYDGLVDPPLETARILNLVSDLIPESAWLTQLEFKRDNKDMQLILNGLARTSGKASKLIEIQNFANGLKDKMEESLGPASQASPNVKKKIKVTVTTSSQKADAEKAETILFTAAFKTDKFDHK